MNREQHPSDETLGAFIDGRLTGAARAEIVEHLADCDECMALVRGVSNARRDGIVPAAESVPRFRRRPVFLAAAAVVIALLGVLGYRTSRPHDGVQALIDAAPASYRTVEPRLAGFRWAELRRLRASEPARPDSEGLRLAGAAGDVLARTERDSSAAAHRSAGVASLLVRDVAHSVEELQASVDADPKNARAWSDLAAALYTSATLGRAADLPRALAAADRALRLDPSLAEARFNRALILERMGLRQEAAAAWRDYAAHDPESQWVAEARRHLDALAERPQARFGDRVRALEAATAAGDRVSVDATLADFPREVRAWFEADVLGRWGEAIVRGDNAAAEPLLRGARVAGEAVAAKSGDAMLAGAVAAIDHADGARRLELARAHAGYRAGRLAYRDRKLAEAEQQFRDAAARFDGAQSPMSGLARAYAAEAIFDENRIADAASLAEPLTRGDGTGVALRAQAAMLLGRCDAYACRWSDALRHLTLAQRAYVQLGEASGVAEAAVSLGDVYANAGDAENAWTQRLRGFSVLGAGGPRLLAALATAARAELRGGEWATAESLLQLEIAEAMRIGDPLLIADAFKRRAMLHAQRGEEEGAAADLREAHGYGARAADSGLRRRFAAECSLVEGVLLRRGDAARSASAFAEAIDFSRTSGDRRLLPEALLERARTLRAAGRADEAWSDVAAGIDEVEDRRRTADGGPGATLEAATALFEEAIDLLLARGEKEKAFEYAERARARALLDVINGVDGAPRAGADQKIVAETAAALPAGGALVEYALLPRQLVVFRITREGLSVAERPLDRAALEEDVRTLGSQLETHAPVELVRTTSARLDAALLAPLRELGAEPESLVLVGDRVLDSVPWAALWNAGERQYLVERTAVSVAPSAKVWLHEQQRLAGRRGGDRLLLVTSDQRRDLDPLDELRAERGALEAAYPAHVLLTDGDATPERFLAAAADADVIHYAGHARAGSATAEAALLLGANGELTAARIAKTPLARPRLVVLSACDTFGARSDSGSGDSHDLARAFLAAGVPAIAGTLWPIRDADAAPLFTAFHQRLRAGLAPAAALREAQLSMLHDSRGGLAHPAAWAAAEIVGATR